MTEALVGVSAECPLENVAGRGAVKKSSPLLELLDAIARLLRVNLRHSPVVDELSAGDRVAKMNLPIVGGVDAAERRSDAALGHDGVGFAEERFANDTDGSALSQRFDRRAQARAPRADDEHVVLVRFVFFRHRSRRSRIAPEATERT